MCYAVKCNSTKLTTKSGFRHCVGAHGWVAGLPAMGAVLGLGAGWPPVEGSPWTSQASNLHIAMQLLTFVY